MPGDPLGRNSPPPCRRDYECIERASLAGGECVRIEAALEHDQEMPGRIVGGVRVADVPPVAPFTYLAVDRDIQMVGNVRPLSLSTSVGKGILALREALQRMQLFAERLA